METNLEQTKFFANLSLSNKEIKEQRGLIIVNDVVSQLAIEKALLSQKKGSLETTIMKLGDLSPETKYSLRSVDKEFNGKDWLNDLKKAHIDLELLKVEIAVIDKIEKEWFTPIKPKKATTPGA